MSVDRDPRSIEEQSQVEQGNYKVYKRRWLVLFAMFSVILIVGLHRCLISIADILDTYMGTTIDDYDLMAQVSMYTILVSVLAMARALDYFGLRKIAYVACVMIICANGLKALCCCDEKYVTNWIKPHRFQILLLSEVFVGLAQSIAFCIPAKVAGSWFAHYESTLAMVIANCGFNIGIGFSNYFTPIFIQSSADMYKLSYMFLVSGVVVTFIVLTCVTRSSPKMPPSSSAIISASTMVPLKNGIAVMMSDWNYVLLLVTLSLNLSTLMVTQMVLEDILQAQQYSNSFCGTLIANVVASFGCSLMYPALFQTCLRGAASILPEATVAAIIIVLQQLMSGILMNSFSPLKRLSPKPGGYQAPMIIFACIVMIVNFLYATSFKAPSRDELQARLRNQGGRTILIDESLSRFGSIVQYRHHLMHFQPCVAIISTKLASWLKAGANHSPPVHIAKAHTNLVHLLKRSKSQASSEINQLKICDKC